MSYESKNERNLDYDVVVIGAGIGGINSAYYLETQRPPGTSYIILESRNSIGGTWDLFKYPGIRSDSDIYSFGFSWNPWTKPQAIATAPEILEYLKASVRKYRIDQKIKFNHKVISAEWFSERSNWLLRVETGRQTWKTISARFIILATGYYDYETPFQPAIPNLGKFRKPITYPQFWPQDTDCADENIVVIGSGATAITLVPSLAKKSRHTTMLQRTPSYVLSLPRQITGFRMFLKAILPLHVFAWMVRFQFIMATSLLYHFCVCFPNVARRILEKATAKELGNTETIKPHFSPPYGPWQQRLCISPDGDFYSALRSGKASIVTDTIETVTEDEIILHSGEILKPDRIVIATGLKIRFAGGLKIYVDGCTVDAPQKYAYKGCMIQDVPNLAFVIGYAHAAWTLGCEVTSTMIIRLLHRMKKRGAVVVTPVIRNSKPMLNSPMLPLTSTYLKSANLVFPMYGTGQWKPRWNYLFDYWEAEWGDLDTDLCYS